MLVPFMHPSMQPSIHGAKIIDFAIADEVSAIETKPVASRMFDGCASAQRFAKNSAC